MQDFERFFEEDTLATENIVNDYAKWWEDAFLPHMKEKAEKLKYNCEHVGSFSEISDLRTQLDEGEKRCKELMSNPSSIGNVIKAYLAFWCGASVLTLITAPLTGGLATIVSIIVDAATREAGDGPFSRIEKSARIGLEIINTCRKILDSKEKEFKKAEKASKKK